MTNIPGKIRKSEFLKNVFTLVSANTVAQSVAILIYIVISRVYTPAELGLFALYMSIISITSIVCTGKYELAVMIPEDEAKGAGLMLISVLLAFFTSLILLILVILFNDPLAEMLGNKNISGWLFFVPLSTFLVGSFQSFSYWYNRKKIYKRIASANLSQSLINSAVKVSAFDLLKGGGGLIAGALTGQIAGFFIFLAGFFKQKTDVFRKISLKNIKALMKEFRLFPKYNMPHYLVNNFSSSLPVFIFSSHFSAEQVGYYSLGFLMVNRPMNLLINSVTQVFSQRVIEKYNKGIEIFPDVKKLVWRFILIGIGPFLLAGFFGPKLFTFIFGDAWFFAGKYMQVLLPWLFIVFLSSPLSFLPDVMKRQRKAMFIDFIKFSVRLLVLILGVLINDIYLSIVFFSAVSSLIIAYNLYWYLLLARKADKTMILRKPE